MPAEPNITANEIAHAERVLLSDGQTFDDERKAFIVNLDTIDLQAVPGSGKTTVLLAKLLALEGYLPFEDGSGVLAMLGQVLRNMRSQSRQSLGEKGRMQHLA